MRHSLIIFHSGSLLSSREKITGTITDTLKRNAKRKRTKASSDIPNFLFVNKPYFSSEESLADKTGPASPTVTNTINSSSSPGSSLPTSRTKRYRSELTLRSNMDHSEEESDTEEVYSTSTLGRASKNRPRSRHSTSTYRSDHSKITAWPFFSLLVVILGKCFLSFYSIFQSPVIGFWDSELGKIRIS